MKTSLFKDLARSGWHSSLMTTYSVDPAFYDGSIEYRLRTYGCENNILMADAIMLKRALGATPEAFRNAGRRYVIAPIQVSGCFHPKVHLRLGTDKARLTVGSANATAAGWGSNQEIVTAIDWAWRGDDPTLTVTGPLIRKAYDYLESWLRLVPGDTLDFKLRLHKRDSPWLNDLNANVGPIELPDRTAIDLFCERGVGEAGMLDRLVALVANEKPKQLVVVSPYWDSDLSALHQMRRVLNYCPTFIVLNPEKNQFPINALEADDAVLFVAIRDDEQDVHRFVHAKIVLIQTDVADHMLFGSANCSDEALGSIARPARNAEVSVYRRFPLGRGLELLGLDLSAAVNRSEVRPAVMDSDAFESGTSAMPAGTIEVVDRALTWWPPRSVDGVGASILLAGDEISVNPKSNGQFRASLAAEPNFPAVARVRFSNGALSDPVIVHDDTALKLASPGVTDRRLRSAFNRVIAGEEDIIDLALQAHLLFATEEGLSPKQGHAKERSDRKVRVEKTVEYATPEEFRRAVALRPATGTSGRFSLEDPGLLDLLAIILHGVTDVGAKEARKQQEEDEDRDLRAGEIEDGDENSDIEADEEPKGAGEPQKAQAGPERIFTEADIDRRRRQLLKAMSAFESMLNHLALNPSSVSTRITAQTAFIINLMLFACTKRHQTIDGSTVTLMAMIPAVSIDRELTFAVRVGRLLQQIWIGHSKGALADHLLLDARNTSLPDDLFFLIVMSRWAIARAFIAASVGSELKQLAVFLRTAAVKIYRATHQLGPLDADAERRFLERLDANLGFSSAETAKLVDQYHSFSQSLSPK